MNTMNGTGELLKNAVYFENEKSNVLKFTVASRFGYDEELGKEKYEFVPCVVFNPREDQIEELVNGQGKIIEFRGRVATRSFKSNDEKVYRTEVIINPNELFVIKG